MADFEAASLALQETANTQAFWIGLGQITAILLGPAVGRWEGSARVQEHADHDTKAVTTSRTLLEWIIPLRGSKKWKDYDVPGRSPQLHIHMSAKLRGFDMRDQGMIRTMNGDTPVAKIAERTWSRISEAWRVDVRLGKGILTGLLVLDFSALAPGNIEFCQTSKPKHVRI